MGALVPPPPRRVNMARAYLRRYEIQASRDSYELQLSYTVEPGQDLSKMVIPQILDLNGGQDARDAEWNIAVPNRVYPISYMPEQYKVERAPTKPISKPVNITGINQLKLED